LGKQLKQGISTFYKTEKLIFSRIHVKKYAFLSFSRVTLV